MQVAHLYKITHQPTGYYYYGKHNGTTQDNTGSMSGLYWGSGKAVKDLIAKYGKKDLTYQILCIADTDYIFELESKVVTKELIQEKLCLNISAGGLGSPMKSEEAKKAQSERMKGRMVGDLNPSKRQDVRDKLKGKPAWNKGLSFYYDESGNRIEGRKPKKGKPDISGDKNPFYGKSHTAESKRKISESLTGRVITEEFKKKRSDYMSGPSNPFLGKPKSDSTKQKISEANKALPKFQCVNCLAWHKKSHLVRYHNDNCKQKE
jgi:hypothetical protein